jgi:hypothetical protein
MNDEAIDSGKEIRRQQSFFDRKKVLRAVPGNCTRCGLPNPDLSRKTCQPCRLYRVKYLLRKKWKPISLNEAQRQLTELEARVYELERGFKHFRIFAKNAYQRGYAKGYHHSKKAGNTPV